MKKYAIIYHLCDNIIDVWEKRHYTWYPIYTTQIGIESFTNSDKMRKLFLEFKKGYIGNIEESDYFNIKHGDFIAEADDFEDLVSKNIEIFL